MRIHNLDFELDSMNLDRRLNQQPTAVEGRKGVWLICLNLNEIHFIYCETLQFF